MDSKPPYFKTSLIVIVGGLTTAFLGISGLNTLSNHLKNTSTVSENSNNPPPSASKTEAKPKDISAQTDIQSSILPAKRIALDTKKNTLSTNVKPTKLSEAELKVAQIAWQYFINNWQETTGLVNSANKFPAVTLWDQSAAMAALVSAKELKLITQQEFDTKMSQTLQTLGKLKLYKNELPNKVYNSQTLLPVNYGELEKTAEIGWSAIDLGRMAIWLKIVGTKYPQFKNQTETIWQSWKLDRLTKAGNMYGTSVIDGKEQYNQEGRLGYENYAAFGLKLWDLQVEKALDYTNKTAFISLYGEPVAFDIRDSHNSGANNYVLSEPYFLDGIETGFQALPKAYADKIFAAQQARYKATNQLTAITEDNLDREPYFLYNTLYVNGQPWATITDTGKNYNHLRFLSTKAAIGWYVLYPNKYSKKLFNFVQANLASESGWYSGYYENLEEVNQALTANNNGIILECLLYKQVGKPLLIWAGVNK